MAGETDNTDLTERERQAAEDRAFELNPYGTGVDPDMDLNYDYDYEASPELTDADYQPNNSFSDDFTNYAGADPYASQFGQDDEEENADDEGDEQADTYADDYGDEQEDWDGDDEEEDEEDDENNEDGEDEADGNGESEDGEGAQKDAVTEPQDETQKHKGLFKRYQEKAVTRTKGKPKSQKLPDTKSQNLKINWNKGDPINLKILSEAWGECRKIKQVRPLMDSANQALQAALIATGPNLMIKLNKYIESVQEQNDDLIGSLLKLTRSNGKRMALTTGAIFEAIFDQQWLQPVMLATLPSTLEGLISAQPLQGVLNKVFSVAVPIINGTAKQPSKGK